MDNENYEGKRWNKQEDKLMNEDIYVSSELLKNYNNNDLYLRRQVNKLWDCSAISTRKTFSPIPEDSTKSYGVRHTDHGVYLDNSTLNRAKISFTENNIDTNNTTMVLNASKNYVFEVPHKKEPTEEGKTFLDGASRNFGPSATFDEGHEGDLHYMHRDDNVTNKWWYIAFSRGAEYRIKPEWMSDDDDVIPKMPSHCQAQVFEAKKSGQITAVYLNLGAKGLPTERHPLFVQIVECVEKEVTQKKKKIKDYIPPDMSVVNKNEKVICSFKIQPEEIQGNGRFSLYPKMGGFVEEGKHYAIVFRSNLTHPNNAYQIGGWTRKGGCYSDPSATFYSQDNGYTWVHHGTTRNAPKGFLYQVEIDYGFLNEYVENTQIMSKKIDVNPCKNFNVSAEILNEKWGTVQFQIWNNATRDWTNIELGKTYSFEDGELPDLLMICAKVNVQASSENAPEIKNIYLNVGTERASEGLLRTIAYAPISNGLMSPAVYSEFNAPIVSDDPYLKDSKVDIVKDVVRSETINLTTFKGLPSFKEVVKNIKSRIELIDDIIAMPEEREEEKQQKALEIKNFLTNEKNKEMITECHEQGIFIVDDDDFNSVDVKENLAPPVISLVYNQTDPLAEEPEIFEEWKDYEIDYDLNKIIFYEETIAKLKQGDGNLVIEYNPVFIKGITQAEMPLKLDIYSESFFVTEDMVKVATYEFKLRTSMIDPVYDVLLYAGTDNEVELEEFKHYKVDYDNHIVTLIGDYAIGTKVTVKYTPLLDESKLCLSYHLKRKNTNNEMKVEPYYFETRI